MMIFCSGACSHLETFDYKPELVKRDGQPMPGADKLVTFQDMHSRIQKAQELLGKADKDVVNQQGEEVAPTALPSAATALPAALSGGYETVATSARVRTRWSSRSIAIRAGR